MQSKEVNLAHHSSGANNTLAVAEQIVAENINEVVCILSLASGGDDRLSGIANRLPAVLLESLDNLSGLHIWLVMM